MPDESKLRAVAMRLEEKDDGSQPSWNEIRERLEAEGFGKFTRATVQMTVRRILDERAKGAA
jgi:hypothetical protein